MLTFEGTEIADVYPRMIKAALDQPIVRPRGKPCREFTTPVSCTTWTWGGLANAGVNYRFATAEALAYLAGWDDVGWVARFNNRIAEFSDDGESFYGHYGRRLYGQLDAAYNKLFKDSDSRQVVLQIWQANDLIAKSKDLPCNTEVHLKIRNGALRMLVMRRSSDLIWGVPNDHHAFWFLLNAMSTALDVPAGPLIEVADSLHLYEPEAGFYDYERVQKAMKATKRNSPWAFWSFVAPVSLNEQRLRATRCRRIVEDRPAPGDQADVLMSELAAWLRREP